jgi:hypothetical protein
MDDRVAESVEVRRFCGRCRRESAQGEMLCRTCGDALQGMGYCPVCEGRVMAPSHGVCPKHEIELIAGPVGSEFEASTSRLVTIATYGIPGDAHGPRLRLEAEGIPAFLQGQRMGAIYQVATGGVKLQVPEEFADDARVLLSQTWSPPKDGGDDPDDPWEGLGPDPSEHRRSVMKGLILVLLFGPLACSLIGWLLSGLRHR